MTRNYINIKTLTDFSNGLTGLDKVNNRTKLIDKKDKIIGSCFAFFKNFCQHTLQTLQSHSDRLKVQDFQKNGILQALKNEIY